MKQAENTPFDIKETKKTAEKLVKNLSQLNLEGACVIGLHGDLGAGKTTFMQFFGEALGVSDKILSPTFVIEKIYKINHPTFEHLVHIDAYRLESESELKNLGWEEIVSNPKNIIAVEWAEKVAGLLPKKHVRIDLSHHDEGLRIIKISLPNS